MEFRNKYHLTEYFRFLFDRFFYAAPDLQESRLGHWLEITSPVFHEDLICYPRLESFKWDEQAVIELFQTSATLEAHFIYRLSNQIFKVEPTNHLLPFLANLMKLRCACELYYSTNIGKGFCLQHGTGVVIGPRNVIGDHFTVHQCVTIGQRKMRSPNERVIIGNNVVLGAGSKILGNITIGDNVNIAANAVLLMDAKPDCTYAGIPAKLVRSNAGSGKENSQTGVTEPAKSSSKSKFLQNGA